jgi:DNA-binding NarL/FixJ family response regulator
VEESISVAVVDGNPRARREVARRLREVSGLALVGEAGGATDAIALLRERGPDVVVTDPRHVAPGGAALLGRLSAAAPDAAVVVLTVYVTEAERAELLAAGAAAVVLKEIASESLVRTIRSVAARAAARTRRAEA